jgi:hypothetical protein
MSDDPGGWEARERFLGQFYPDTVTIPRARYEALTAAAKALSLTHGFIIGKSNADKIDQAIAALRAAGIDLEDKPHPSSLMGHVERKP